MSIEWRHGSTTDSRTRAMITEVDRLTPYHIIIVQGSWSGVAASGGTHAGEGALDIDTRGWSTAAVEHLVWVLRTVGFAAWHRTPSMGDWIDHVHVIALGDAQLSPGAQHQETDYRNGLNGLANDGPDYHRRPSPIVTWEQYKAGLPTEPPPEWDETATKAQVQAVVTEAVLEALGSAAGRNALNTARKVGLK